MLLLPAAAAVLFAHTPAVRVVPDVTYATIDKLKLQLDLVLPNRPGPHPVVLCFHGGAWTAGSRKELTSPALLPFATRDPNADLGILENLARRGYAAASVSYRLAPKHKYPAQIEDAKTAVRFLRANAKQFDVDPDRVAALGFSAGGHLALLLGTTTPADGLDGKLLPDVSSKVQCVIDFFGPTDMSLYADTPGVAETFIASFLGKECLTDARCYKRASPIEYVTKQAAPTLIIHGTVDLVVPIIHSERMYDKLKDAGVPTEFVKIRWKGHGWEDREATRTAADAALTFLDTHLKAKDGTK